MSRHSDMEQHLQHLSEMRNILNAMKNLAFMESRKLFRLLQSQQQMVANLERVAADFLKFHPFPDSIDDLTHDIYLIIGSERGFCGNFNEKLLQWLDQQLLDEESNDDIIVVGNKLARFFETDPRVASVVGGANFEEEIESVLNAIVAIVNQLQQQCQYISLTAVYHAEQTEQIIAQQLLPSFQQDLESHDAPYAPLMNLPAATFFTDLGEQYLFAVLHEIFYGSLMVENNWRAQHLDGAVSRLDKNTGTLKQKLRMLRQEAITEEIEVILLGAESLLQAGRDRPWAFPAANENGLNNKQS